MKISDLSPEQQEQLRAKWRDAQQKTRDKKRQDPEEAQSIRKTNEEGLKRRQELGLCFFGEVFPGIDADNITDAIQVCREFARALEIADIQPGESLLDFERRVFESWTRFNRFKDRLDCCWGGGGGPFLNRRTQTLTPGWGESYWLDHCGGFDKSWTPLKGANVPIDVSDIAPLKPIPKPKPEPEPHKVEAPVPSSAVRVTAPSAITKGYDPALPPDARQYLYGA